MAPSGIYSRSPNSRCGDKRAFVKAHRRPSGWQLQNQSHLIPVLPETPTRWHLFLYSLGVKEDEIRGSLSPELRRKVIEWARKNADHCYIPSWMLIEAEIRTRYDS